MNYQNEGRTSRPMEMQKDAHNVFYRIYGWMFFALGLTGFIAYLGAFVKPFSEFIKSNFSVIFPVALIAQLVLVIVLSFFINKISYLVALILFTIYSFLMGIIFTSLFYVYTTSSIITTFFISAGMFGLMALYGAYTKRDLSQIGSILNMALIGLILALLVNLFLKSNMLDIVLSFVGVIVFAGLTAVNIQELKRLTNQLLANEESINKISLIGALTLYLNFINLFLSLLRLLGRRND